ncbi:MAG: hypothetical protein CR975_05005 [Gammaproteobacteria bacterium]|nr:MAG: hypothetical protein CR975_05005 [Gammaproteobacteria bacterium]
MNFTIIFTEGIIWSLLWIIFVGVCVRIFPFTIEHDYPEDVRKIANVPKPEKTQKRLGILFGIAGLSIAFILLLLFVFIHYSKQNVSFFDLFAHLWIICITWNIVDLLIVDWLFICTLSLKFFMLPGTENYPGNKNYKFHFVGFLKGFIVMSIVAAFFAALSYPIIRFI